MQNYNNFVTLSSESPIIQASILYTGVTMKHLFLRGNSSTSVNVMN